MSSNLDEQYMLRAINLARKAYGQTAPNPMVGAVLVKDGKIIGEGYHTKDGAPHAEIECLKSATQSPEGATIYVTLEPCSTHGRTGACCDALIKAKIACVKIGSLDPNPEHAGKALKIFAAHNITCQTSILEEQCRELNFIFNYSITQKRALLALKYAISANGKIAAKRGRPTAITSALARANTMGYRKLFGAIGVGRGTLLSDNPALTARIGNDESCKTRLIFDASAKLANVENLKSYKVFSDKFASQTRIVCDALADKINIEKIKSQGIEIMQVPYPKTSPKEFWDALKSMLYQQRITSLYVEGGAEIIASICQAKAADYAYEYKASNLILPENALGAFDFTMQKKRPFNINGKIEKLGSDILCRGDIVYL